LGNSCRGLRGDYRCANIACSSRHANLGWVPYPSAPETLASQRERWASPPRARGCFALARELCTTWPPTWSVNGNGLWARHHWFPAGENRRSPAGAVLSAFLGYWSAYQTVQTVVVPKPAAAVVTVDAGPLSIVVLPFQNLTADRNEAYVADRLTASLTSDLCRIRDARIVDASTAFAYKHKPLRARQIGRELERVLSK
jgi:hypothetical protein